MTNRYHHGKPARLTDKVTCTQHEPGDVGTYDCESLGFHWVFMDGEERDVDTEPVAFGSGEVEVLEADGAWVTADQWWMKA